MYITPLKFSPVRYLFGTSFSKVMENVDSTYQGISQIFKTVVVSNTLGSSNYVNIATYYMMNGQESNDSDVHLYMLDDLSIIIRFYFITHILT